MKQPKKLKEGMKGNGGSRTQRRCEQGKHANGIKLHISEPKKEGVIYFNNVHLERTFKGIKR